MGSQLRKARLEGARILTHDTSEFAFRMIAPEEISFRAGQFVSVACGNDDAGTPRRRSYSLASPSSDHGGFSLIVKRITDGLASEFFWRLAPGDEIEFTGPMGFFVLDLSHPGAIIFGATGTGIAPVVPMLHELAARPEEKGAIHLFWGVRTEGDLFFRDELAKLEQALPRLKVELRLTQPPPGFEGGRQGRITDPLIETASILDHPTYYLVGNGQMIKEAQALLQARGVDRKRQIRTEAFFK